MSDIVILGAGVMGSALAVPAAEAGNAVTLAGSPLDDELIDTLAWSGRHTALDAALPGSVRPVRDDALDAATLAAAETIVIAVSSPGIPWVTERLRASGARPAILALVTKGLAASEDADAPPLTYADALPAALPDVLPATPDATPDALVGIGGPCIARELALGYPTRVTFASRHRPNAERLRDRLQTDTYRVTTSADIVGVEACAALKNFLCIGISAMFTAHRLGDSHAKNPLAALYNQGVLELAMLSDWLRSDSAARRGASVRAADADGPAPNVAFDLAGLGDLHVTVGGGRNSRLGRHLGEGATVAATLGDAMRGVTVEGVDTGRVLAKGFRAACRRGELDAARLPLTRAILDCLEDERAFALEFGELPG